MSRPTIRKRRLDEQPRAGAGTSGEIDIAASATLAYSSEDPAHPIEHLLDGSWGPGATRWAAERPDTPERIVVELDRPQTLARLVYEVEETERERTQEVHVEISGDGGESWRRVVVQEFNFSPAGATFQRETLGLPHESVSHLRLTVIPNKSGSGTATLSALRLFA